MDPPSTCHKPTRRSGTPVESTAAIRSRPSTKTTSSKHWRWWRETRTPLPIASLPSSLHYDWLSLKSATNSSVDHMHCFSDAAGHIQESVLDAATKGNQYINLCLRKFLRNVDALDTADNKLVRPP
ncbi:hypothetical protein Q3G72_000123 [Acer saccharum]|nr:hypothetical protein Q3G72_000123 [Acer saccharum]